MPISSDMPLTAKISIIIPTRNEAKSIGTLVKELKSRFNDAEVIVVDDGSTDDTGRIAESEGAIIYRHPYNIGNGAAIKSGIRISTGDIIVFMDGDGQHDPHDIEKMLPYLSSYDMVVGARQRGSQASTQRAFGNSIFNRLASYVAKFKIEDLTSGFRMIKADLVRSYVIMLPNSYSYPTTLTLCVLRDGRTIKYVPIQTKARKGGKSGIRLVHDGIRFFLIILKICTIYSPLRIFLPISVVSFLTGLFYSLYTLCIYHRFTNMSALLFTTSLTIFLMGLISEQISQLRFDRISDQRSPL